jgi:hypothetical protein
MLPFLSASGLGFFRTTLPSPPDHPVPKNTLQPMLLQLPGSKMAEFDY